MSLEAMLEAEKRGILSPEKQDALNEARRRGLLKNGNSQQNYPNNSDALKLQKINEVKNDPIALYDLVNQNPDREIFKFPSVAETTSTPQSLKKISNEDLGPRYKLNPLQTFAANVSNYASIGAASPIKALIDEAIEGNPSVIEGDPGFLARADRRRLDLLDSIDAANKENPISAGAGMGVGMATPIPGAMIEGLGKLGAQGLNSIVNMEKLGKLAPFVEKFVSGAGSGLGISAVRGLAEQRVPEGKEVLQDMALSGGLETATQLLSPIFNTISGAAKNTASKLYNSALKTPKKELMAGRNLGEEVLTQRSSPFGITNRGLKKMAKQGLEENESALQKLLSQNSGAIDDSVVRNEMLKAKKNFDAFPGKMQPVGTKVKLDQVDDFIKEAFPEGAGSLSVSEANELKRKLYDMINDNAFFKDQLENPVRTMMQKSQAKGLKKAIEKEIPQAKAINEQLSTHVRLKKAMDAIDAANQVRQPVTLTDLLGAGFGGSAGGAAGGMGGGIVGTLAGYGIPKALNSTFGKTQTAQILKGISALSLTVPEKLKILGRLGILSQEGGVPFKGLISSEGN